MPTKRSKEDLEREHREAAQAYLASLPPEHFVEAWAQGVQREIALESLALIRRQLPTLHYFNELLIQYRLRRNEPLRQVVPDNFVVLHESDIVVEGSFDLELQTARPFWTLEYVSKKNKRKDYDDNFDRYETELKVPYYLHFYPEDEELTLYRRTRGRYVSVKPNAEDRHSIEEIETEVGLLGEWVRFWYRGKLLPLPAELQQKIDDLERQVADQIIAIADRDAEILRLRAEIERLRGA